MLQSPKRIKIVLEIFLFHIMETLIIEQLVKNSDYFKKVIPFLKDEYFKEPSLKVIFNTILLYSGEYNKCPSVREIEIIVQNRKNIPENIYNGIRDVLEQIRNSNETPDTGWLIEQTEKHCQFTALYNLIYDSVGIIEGTDKKGRMVDVLPDLFKNALSISFESSIGEDYYDDAAIRWDYLHQKGQRTTSGIPVLDKALNGGWKNKTFNIFIAPPGVGKTMALVNNAAACLLEGKNVLYVSGEIEQSVVNQRIDANVLDMSIFEVQNLQKQNFLQALNFRKKSNKDFGKLITKEFPTSSANANHIRNLINEVIIKKNFRPDILFLDYLNIFNSVRANKNSNMFERVKNASEEFRALASEFQIPIISATQTNRSGVGNSNIRQDSVAESFGVIATADWVGAIIQTDELNKLDQMIIKQLKSRYDDLTKMEKIIVMVDKTKQKIYNLDKNDTDYIKKMKPEAQKELHQVFTKLDDETKKAEKLLSNNNNNDIFGIDVADDDLNIDDIM